MLKARWVHFESSSAAVFLRCFAIHTPSSNPNLPRNVEIYETLRRPVRTANRTLRRRDQLRPPPRQPGARFNWKFFSVDSVTIKNSRHQYRSIGFLEGLSPIESDPRNTTGTPGTTSARKATTTFVSRSGRPKSPAHLRRIRGLDALHHLTLCAIHL